MTSLRTLKQTASILNKNVIKQSLASVVCNNQRKDQLFTSSISEQYQPQPRLENKVKCTLIPGDGVGPELCFSVKQVFDSIGVPVDFEELFVSEVNPKISVPFDLAIESIRRNGIALKGILSTPFSSTSGELESLNMKIRKQLDLFANVVHIKSMEGKREFASFFLYF
jgi:isocitrate dehydrogenase (NAD+)